MPVMFVKELAALVGITDRRLRQINEALPPEKKLIVREEGEKKADLAMFVRRWTDYKVSMVKKVSDITLEEAKTEHELLKIQKTEIEVKRMQAEVVAVIDVVTLAQEIVAGTKNNLLHIPATLSPILAKVDDPEEIEEIMSDAIRESLEDLSRLKNYEPPVADVGQKDDDEEEDDREWENG